MKTLTIWFRFEICGLQIQNKCEKLHNCRQRVGKQRVITSPPACCTQRRENTNFAEKPRITQYLKCSIYDVACSETTKKAQQSKSATLVITNVHKTATIFLDYVHVNNRIRAFPPNIFLRTVPLDNFPSIFVARQHTDARY